MMFVYGVRRPQLPRPNHHGILGDDQSFLCHTIEEPAKLAGRFPLESTRREEKPLRKQLLILASFALIINSGVALAQQETPQQYDKSGAPSGLRANTGAPETTGQAPNFEDRWSAQRETPDRLPKATLPGADARELLTKLPDLCRIKATAIGTRLLSMLRLLSANISFLRL